MTITRTQNDTGALRCQTCPQTFKTPGGEVVIPTADHARVAGWRVWEGDTIGGRHERRVICPRCVGAVAVDPADEPSWDAVCDTCDACAVEDWDDDLPLSEDDAETWKVEHKCEPEVRIVRPKPPAVRS